jgi:hypothetical protein
MGYTIFLSETILLHIFKIRWCAHIFHAASSQTVFIVTVSVEILYNVQTVLILPCVAGSHTLYDLTVLIPLLNLLYLTLLHLPPLRLHCVRGCWDQTQDCCFFGIGTLLKHAEA